MVTFQAALAFVIVSTVGAFLSARAFRSVALSATKSRRVLALWALCGEDARRGFSCCSRG
jgi:hypothetical protein